MMIVVHIALAVFAFSAIIFLHELGHLLAALWAGMKVETFSIGFGRALIQRTYKGIRWQVGWIPVGGYVRIAGMEGEDGRADAEQVLALTPPWKRMIVVAMGPLVNIVLAWLLFFGVFALGGQQKPFNETSSLVGFVDPASEMAKQIHPGDLILSYDDRELKSAKEHLYAPMLSKGAVKVGFERIDYQTQTTEKSTLLLEPYAHPEAMDKAWKTLGLLSPARVLQIDGFVEQASRFEGSLATQKMPSKVAVGDILVAINGQRVFSEKQLTELLNSHEVVLSVERQGKIEQVVLPTFPIACFDLDASDKLELSDWYYEAPMSQINREQLVEKGLDQCRWIPYNLDARGIVEHPYVFVDPRDTPECVRKGVLRRGDRVLSAQGQSIQHPRELLELLQSPSVALYFKRGPAPSDLLAPKAQEWLIDVMKHQDLATLLQQGSVGVAERGSYYSLSHVKLIRRAELAAQQIASWKEEAKKIPEERVRERALAYIDKKAQEWTLGVQIADLSVRDNPSATSQFSSSLSQITRTLNSLITGQLNPKWLAGPVGMVTMMTQGVSTGLVQALHLLAVLSLNLGIFNLLPLPIFDGGRLVIDGFEALTGKKLSPRVIEVLGYVFIALLIALALFATYWDLSRLWSLWSNT